MATESAYQAQVLARLDDLREDVGEVRVDLRSLRTEVQQTYATEAACLERHQREGEARSGGLKRAWEAIENIEGRMLKLEHARAETMGEAKVTGAIWQWIAALLAALLVGMVVAALRRWAP